MKLIINNQIFKQYPDLVIGVVVAKGIDNTKNTNEIQQQIREIEGKIKANFDKETLSQDPKINIWRKVYSSFGVKSKDAKSSVENLYRLVLRGIELRKINNLVDAYNLISLKYMMPVGGEDIDKIVGDLELTIAGDNEVPVKLLGDDEPEAPQAGEIFYKDNHSAVCRRWNWREADRTKLTENTKNAIFVVEGLPPVGKQEIESAINELKGLVEKHSGGEITTFILDSNNNSMEIG